MAANPNPLTLFDLTGVTALVTGASSGIGRHFALTLARAGADVALAARREAACRSTAEQIEALGRRALCMSLDVTQAASVEAAVQVAAETFGVLNILCNNAGIAITKPFLEQTEQDWDQVLDTNLKGAYLVAQTVARHMVQQGQGGAIINTASMLAFRVSKQLAPYVASKAGLLHLTRALAVELAPYQIRVNAIAPGYIETEINRRFFATEAGQAVVKRIPQRRLGQVDDLDGALLLLASPASRYITGSAIAVDGGHAINPV